jgi:hypothetical protein
MQALHTALHKGPWFMLHDIESLDAVIYCVRQLAIECIQKAKTAVIDVFGEPDDVEFTVDQRDHTVVDFILRLQTNQVIWEKQFIVLFSLWQFPGLLALTTSFASKSVSIFFNNEFDKLMTTYIFGQNATTKQKGAKTEIVLSALSPLEVVQYVIKLLQLAHYHVAR